MRWEQNTEEKIQLATDKKDSEICIMGWGYYKWNKAVLCLRYNKKNMNCFSFHTAKVNPNQTHVYCVYRHTAKLCSYILYKSISLRNVIKEKHHSRNGVQSSTMEFYQVSEKSYLQNRSQYILI